LLKNAWYRLNNKIEQEIKTTSTLFSAFWTKECASKLEVMYPLNSLCSINLQAEPHPWTSYELAKQAKLRLCAADANQDRCRSETAPVLDPHRINEQA
jgi:hypothetical protein